MDVRLGAKGGKDLIGGFDPVEHDAADALLLELGQVSSSVVLALEVFAPLGFCGGGREGRREGGRRGGRTPGSG